MLYWLSAFSDTIGPLNAFRYITLRTGGAMITALALVLLLAPAMVAVPRRGQGRAIRPVGLHMLAALLVATLLWARLGNPHVWIVLGVSLGFGVIGLHADHRKAGSPAALAAQLSIAITAAIAVAACFTLVHLGRPPMATSLGVPFGKEFVVDLGWLYVGIGALFIVAVGKIVNLADKLHGFVVGPLLIAALSFLVIAWLAGNSLFAAYFDTYHLPGVGELAVLCGAVIGAGLGVLWLDAPHVSTHIGNAASLALGGMLGTVAVATKHELVLALICGLFVLKPAPVQG